MAVRDIVLLDSHVTGAPPFWMRIREPNGSVTKHTWFTMDQFRAWYENVSVLARIDPNIVLKEIITFQRANGGMARLNERHNHTFRLTGRALADQGIV